MVVADTELLDMASANILICENSRAAHQQPINQLTQRSRSEMK
jgi:hypothetical protein